MRSYAVVRWLWLVAGLVFVMIVVGGITRLTESGLSITQWKPLTGVMPPLTEAGWRHQFELYQQTTQFQTVNRMMTLADYKFIFFWEWVHRLLGRLIGVAFALPLLWFAWKRAIPRSLIARFCGILLLGGLQGAVGWWMVVSGLVGRTEVSHYRLAVHLMMAFLILVLLVWTALDMRRLAKGHARYVVRPAGFALAMLAVLAVQLVWGAFTAGLRAGHVTNDWPKMGDHWLPLDAVTSGTGWRVLVDDPFVVHFLHRWWAWVVAAMAVTLARRLWRSGAGREASALLIVIALQILLGIWTVMSSISLHVAVTHQAMAALLLIVTTAAAHRYSALADGGAR